MQDDEGSRASEGRITQRAIRDLAVRVARRRMFSDLSDAQRDELVETALEALTFAWGPPGCPADPEAWLGRGMYHAMMADFGRRRMLLRPARRRAASSLDDLLAEWVSTEPVPADSDPSAPGPDLTDRFLRVLSPADARLLWMRCEGYTHEEIADLLGIRANAVTVRLRRLQLRLRETLEPVTDHLPAPGAKPGTGAEVG